MNRSFNRSQPLRNADCNAVEVKSKVSLGRVFMSFKCGFEERIEAFTWSSAAVQSDQLDEN